MKFLRSVLFTICKKDGKALHDVFECQQSKYRLDNLLPYAQSLYNYNTYTQLDVVQLMGNTLKENLHDC